jgi:hypothetical protein
MRFEPTRYKLTQREWGRILDYVWISGIVLAVVYHLFWVLFIQLLVASATVLLWRYLADKYEDCATKWEATSAQWKELYYKSDEMYRQLHLSLFPTRNNVN